MRQKCRIPFFSMSDHSTYFEQKKKKTILKKNVFYDLSSIFWPHQPPESMTSSLFMGVGCGGGLYWKSFLTKMSLDKFYIK